MATNALFYSAAVLFVLVVASTAAPAPSDSPGNNTEIITPENVANTQSTTEVTSATNVTVSNTTTLPPTTTSSNNETSTMATNIEKVPEQMAHKNNSDASNANVAPSLSNTTVADSNVTVNNVLPMVENATTHVKLVEGTSEKVEKPTRDANINTSAADAHGKCSSELQFIISQSNLKGSVNLYPEKFIFDVSESPTSHGQDYCVLLNSTVQHVHEACLKIDSTDETEVAASKRVASLLAMIATLCSKDPTELKVTENDAATCMGGIKNATKDCSPTTRQYSYPTEMLINEMGSSPCKNLTDARDCVVEELKSEAACSAAHQQVVVYLMNSLLGDCKSVNSTEEPTPMTSDNSTTAAANATETSTTIETTTTTTTVAPTVNVTAAPSQPSASPSRNAAEGLRLHSVILLLSLALVAVAPARSLQ